MDILTTPGALQACQHTLPDRRAHRELAALNDRFLELVRAMVLAPTHTADGNDGEHILGLDISLAEQVAHLPSGRRRELAACPYALVGVGLDDLAFWRAIGEEQRPDGYRRAPGGNPYSAAHAAAWRDALFLTLAYAWHLAQTAPITARWMLGACPQALALMGALPFSTLGRIADECPGLLQARLANHKRFWEDLIAAVASGARQSRFAAVSLGLQLSAAAGASRRVDES